jgi:hypothetical protein
MYAPAQDLRHTISFVGPRPVPRRAGRSASSARAQSGRPYTEVVGRENVSEFVDGIEWVPVLGCVPRRTVPLVITGWTCAASRERSGSVRRRRPASVEVLNAYGRKNLYDYRYVDGFARAEPVRMLPFMPTFGFSVAF